VKIPWGEEVIVRGSYDVVIMGGGLAGATLAKSLAERAVRVLVVEREREFKDRIRGEQMQPWGVAEARALGVYDLLKQTCGHEQPWVDMFLGPTQIDHRHLASTTPQAAAHFNFYHPRLQETLLRAATDAGADVRRGATVTEVRQGSKPIAVIDQGGTVEAIPARLVVGADGRSSGARRCRDFIVKQDAPFLLIAGLLVDDMKIPDDTGLIHLNPMLSQGAYFFPQGGGRVRAYTAYPAQTPRRLQGEKDVPRFIEQAAMAGAPPDIFDGSRPAGPLASFDASDTWVEHPYSDNVVLIGDAAASNDPSWGQGLSITLRDVRVLRDRLLDTADWNAACHDYAREHDHHYGVIHEVTLAFKDMFMRSGPEADARRGRALPLVAQDPKRVPDQLFSGPDLPWNETIRKLFFAEESDGNQKAAGAQ
jgi:2-polyprenyl-6-methoxyphenol hydroxylase-like FAD-dependent oxidoreductase